LITQTGPAEAPLGNIFHLDLVEEWFDLTGLPYVHGCWVVREGHWAESDSDLLREAKTRGTKDLSAVASSAAKHPLSPETVAAYLSSFSYDLGEEQEASLSEFFRYSFFHGVLGDIPDINLASPEE